jgi:CTP synthase (UTP-ammonia lyase)
MGSQSVRIGIIGDFNPEYRSHHATNSALEHAANRLGVDVETVWLPTPALSGRGVDEILANYDGLWAASGSPYDSLDGALAAIQFARTRNWPFVGT